jgi:DNA polymerase-3 subunit gamma/tau
MTAGDDDAPGFDLGPEPKPKSAAYRVLARKYRPQGFDALIGQDALVRTLGNAFALGRIAHAFMLTGVRGVGKTTTARIIAKALNCVGEDGKRTEPALKPCGRCVFCREIAESRHVDVLEMDAASRTGIDDIREIVDGVRYAPASARYKVYIIDEVHMLSKAAFNGLLKTLEEPPPHAKFIFATTEIRKVPVTVLSRCQRFDLRRVSHSELVANLEGICAAEGYAAEPQALAHIARAAQGSVRDAQSLLDQAMAHAAGGAAGEGADMTIAAEPVRRMLGLADRTRVLDLFEMAMEGRAADAVAEFRAQYELGADPLTVLQDVTGVVHEITRLKLSAGADLHGWAEQEGERARGMADRLSVPSLTRAWQILLKALGEVQTAPDAAAATDMALVRLCFAAELPPAERLARVVMDASPKAADAPRKGPEPRPSESRPSEPRPSEPRGPQPRAHVTLASAHARPERAPEPDTERPQVLARPKDWKAVAALAGEMKALKLKFQIEHQMRLIRFDEGRIEVNVLPNLDRGAAGELAERLTAWTGQRWLVSVSNEEAGLTLAAQAAEAEAERRAQAAQDPLLKAALEVFPGARIIAVRDLGLEPEPAGESEADR